MKQIAGDILRLPDSEAVDVDPEVTPVRTGSETGRVPDCRPPGRVELGSVGDKAISKHFPRDPGQLSITEYVFIFLSTASKRLITRSGYVAAQKVPHSIGDERLTWPSGGVSREVVGEEPGAESQLGVFPQGGVRDLSPALFSWQ